MCGEGGRRALAVTGSCEAGGRRKACPTTGSLALAATGLFGIAAEGAEEGVLGLVEGGDGGDIVAPGAGEFFFGEQVFEDAADGLGAALAGELRGFFGGIEGGAERGELGGEGGGAGGEFNDLAANGVAGLLEFEFAAAEAGFAAADAALVE